MARIPAILGRALTWACPSVGAAAAGALLGAAIEAPLHLSGRWLVLTSAGFAVTGLWPLALTISVAARLAAGGWRALLGGGAAGPAARSWAGPVAAVALLCAAALAATAWSAVAWASAHTAFRPTTVAIVVAGAVGVVALALAALAPPAARGLHAMAVRRPPWGRQRRRAARAALLLGAVGGAALALGALARWIDLRAALTIALAPALALAATALMHRLLSRRRAALAASCVGALALAVTAQAVRLLRPALVLDTWAAPTVASEVIESLHPLEALRARVAPAGAKPREVPGATHPDIVLVTIDTVRADRTPLGGGPAPMPTLTTLGQRGAVMTHAFAPSNVTRRSLPSLATGLSPTRVRGKVFGWALQLDPRHVLLAERFAAAGYRTLGYFCCESFWSRSRRLGLERGISELKVERDGAVLAERAAAALRAARNEPRGRPPLWMWVHLIEPHQWNGGGAYLPPPELARQRYDAALTRADALVGTILSGLEGGPPALVVVTSDHGEGLGDHGAPFHSSDLYDSQLRVPLVIAGPGIAPARHAEVTGLIDLAPTLLELAGYEVAPEQLEGRSLAALLRGQRPSQDDGGYAFAAMIRDRSVSEESAALVRGRHKLIVGPRTVELYDLAADPGELRNLSGSSPQLGELRRMLRERASLDAASPFAPLAR